MNIKALAIKQLFAALFMLTTLNVSAQSKDRAHLDSLLRRFPAAKEDTNKVKLLIGLARSYIKLKKTDSAGYYIQPALALTAKLRWRNGYYAVFEYLWDLNDYGKVRALAEDAEAGLELEVYLEKQEVRRQNGKPAIPFTTDPFRRHCLLNGLDDIALTLQKVGSVEKFEQRRSELWPWLDGFGYKGKKIPLRNTGKIDW